MFPSPGILFIRQRDNSNNGKISVTVLCAKGSPGLFGGSWEGEKNHNLLTGQDLVGRKQVTGACVPSEEASSSTKRTGSWPVHLPLTWGGPPKLDTSRKMAGQSS